MYYGDHELILNEFCGSAYGDYSCDRRATLAAIDASARAFLFVTMIPREGSIDRVTVAS